MRAQRVRSDNEHPVALRRAARGFTLIELIVSIVVVSVAVAGVMGLLSDLSSRSGDLVVQEEATALASAYLNEVLSRPFADPDGIPGEASRSAYDDVSDYNGLLDVGARDQFNQPIPGMSRFTVAVQVSTPAAGALGAVAQSNMLRVDVTATHPTGARVVLSGYRTKYP
ncbi:MAG TPA: prepilin-type N-terminal cleavage/methylation domain-containing protein [Steroidobacteraceae bacterium]